MNNNTWLNSTSDVIAELEKDKLLDKIINSFDFLDIRYINSPTISNSVLFQDQKVMIIWNNYYWECYRAYLYSAIYYRHDSQLRTQNVIAEMARFISEKYNLIKQVAKFTRQIYNQFHISQPLTSIQEEFIDMQIKIGKVFSLFHEIGHIYYKWEYPEANQKRDFILKMFSALDKDDFDPNDKWSGFSWNCITKVLSGAKKDILEEIVCDAYATEQTAHILNGIEELTPVDSAKAIVVATENLLNFQSMFNSINIAWNRHYAEIKYHLALKSYEPVDEVNELAILRNQLGAMINTSLVCRLFSLAPEERTRVWSDRDIYHIDNEQVVLCMADDDFIRQTISDSFTPAESVPKIV